MKSNLGRVDRILRFALAFWWLGPWKPEYHSLGLNLIILVLAIIALIESFIGWCGLHTILGINNREQ